METQQLEQWNTYMDVDTGEYLGEGIFLSREYVEKKQEAQVNKAEGFAKKKKKDEFSQYINSNFGSFYRAVRKAHSFRGGMDSTFIL